MRLSTEYRLRLPCPCDPIVLQPDASITLNDVADHEPTLVRPVREDTLTAWQAVFRGAPHYVRVAGGGFQNGGEQIGVGRVSPCDGPYGDVFAIFN